MGRDDLEVPAHGRRLSAAVEKEDMLHFADGTTAEALMYGRYTSMPSKKGLPIFGLRCKIEDPVVIVHPAPCVVMPETKEVVAGVSGKAFAVFQSPRQIPSGMAGRAMGR